MRTHRIVQTALLSVLGLFAFGAAHATAYTLNPNLTSTFQYYTYSVPAPTTNNTSGSFTDMLSFTVSSPSVGLSTVANIALSSILNINNLTVALYEGASGSGTQLVGPVAAGSPLSYNSLTAGNNYYFQVMGNATGTDGGAYTLGAEVEPVPEPSDAILMAVGLGLIGFLAIRNKQHA